MLGQVRCRRIVGIVAAGVGGLLVLAVAAVYLAPLGGDDLRSAPPRRLTFDAALNEADRNLDAEQSDRTVRRECWTKVLTHATRTAKAVLLLHGYNACPSDFDALAERFFAAGYNVYAPREGHHGRTDASATAGVRAAGLVEYANESLNIAAGLGDEVGVVGVSGGGVLATWLTEFRPDVVERALILSPFYRPSPARAPAFATKPLTVLYGGGILPDHVGADGFSFRGLSQYLRVVANLKDTPRSTRLHSIAVVTSPGDTFIDFEAAHRIPKTIADANQLTVRDYVLPAELGLPHNIVRPLNDGGATAAELITLYRGLYEGTVT